MRRIVKTIPVSVWDFNPRTPVGCDRPDNTSLRGGAYFNPRTPVGCDFMRWRCFSFVCSFQSTHPSGVRQAEFPAASQPVAISIHAPQWGATREECGEVVQVDISIHAPQWGATLGVMAVGDGSLISIHAPQWGATRIRLRMPTCTRFQSTHPSGVRRVPFYFLIGLMLFQSTHPSGVRRLPGWFGFPRGYFNPRTPVGCDTASTAPSSNI